MSYYGANGWRARWASWQDARAGRLAQANARLGGLKLPGDRGPVLWLQGGDSRDQLRLGVELCRAISDKRRDLRMILTFEQRCHALSRDRSRDRAPGLRLRPLCP